MSRERATQESTLADSVGGSGAGAGGDWRGKLIGRYVVVGLLGAGGFGVVLSAFDPDLGRRVAIKLVVAPGEAADAAQARLSREGKAIARLSHPNVVAVHDVGIADGRVFVAMEHVDGEDLRAWLAASPRPLAEILDAFLQAGRGLAAVHRVGIVHRDFKPANVLVGRDGQVKVADFGLARETTAGLEPAHDPAADARAHGGTPEPSAAAGPETPRLAALTLRHGPLGTPGYMAPEQYLGEPATAASDQFSFCVALYEALARQKPFVGEDLPAVQAEVRAGNLRAWPRGNPTPPWLRALIARGLAFQASARFPSLAELLDRIEAGRRAPGRKRRLAVAGLVALGLVGGGVFLARRDDPDVARCRAAGDRLGGAWDPARRAAVHQAFVATGLPYAAATSARLAGALDRYASSWRRMRVESCEATHVRGEQSAALLDLRTRCLDRHRAALDALTTLYAGAPDPARPDAPGLDAAAVDAALAAAGNLPPLADCADAAALTAVTPLPRDPALRARLSALDEELARVAALDAAGQHAQGLERARAAAAEALALAHPPAVAAALYRRASLERALGDAGAAHLTLDQALDAAVAAGDDEREAEIWIAELELRANELLDPAAALALERTAATALARAGAPTRLHLRLLGAIAGAHQAAAAYGTAATRLSEALALARQELGPEDPLTLELELSLATQLIYSSQFARAHEIFAVLLPTASRVLGESHPFTIRVIADIGVAYLEEKRDAEARPWFERAAKLYEAIYGPVHPRLAATLSNLAIILRRQKDLEGALRLSERVLEIDIATRGPEHPDVAGSWNQVGMLLRDLGRYDEAREKHFRALAIYEKTLGPKHRDVARVHNSLALLYEQEGRGLEALPHMEQELAIRLGYPEHAVSLGRVHFGLGKHLHAIRRDPARSRELLARARQIFVEAKEDAWVKRVDDWVAEKRLPPLVPR